MMELRTQQIGLQRAGMQVRAGTEWRRIGLAPERNPLKRLPLRDYGWPRYRRQ